MSDKYTWFPSYCKGYGLPEPVMEHRFHEVRKWKFDFAWPEHRVALEVEGGLFIAGGGRHNRGASMLLDMEKYNEATLMGWRILRYTPDQLRKSKVYEDITRAINE